MVKLLPCDHEVMGSSPRNSPKVVGPFPGPCASGSYMHQVALFFERKVVTPIKVEEKTITYDDP